MVVKSPDPPQPNPFAKFAATKPSSSVDRHVDVTEPEVAPLNNGSGSEVHPGGGETTPVSASATLQDQVESSKSKQKGVANDQQALDLYTARVLYERARMKEAKDDIRANVLPIICQRLNQITDLKTNLDAFSEVSDIMEFLKALDPSDLEMEKFRGEYRKAETQVREGFNLMTKAKENLQSVLAGKC